MDEGPYQPNVADRAVLRLYAVETFVECKRVECWAARSWDEAVWGAQERAQDPRWDYVQAVESDGRGKELRVRSEPEGLEISFESEQDER